MNTGEKVKSFSDGFKKLNKENKNKLINAMKTLIFKDISKKTDICSSKKNDN